MIEYAKQCVEQDDLEGVINALKSPMLTQGPLTGVFEDGLCRRTGANQACVVSSATAALHVACLALGVTQGDIVWTSPISFVASANAARYCGANVDFVDIDQGTLNICPLALKQKMRHASELGDLPKVLILVHMGGQPTHLQEISEICKHYGVKVVEDASHALGARYGATLIGDCFYSDLTVFSFHAIKIITTGEGGAICSKDPLLVERARLFRSHGITRDPERMVFAQGDPWYYEQLELGFNYRMTEIQAALGIAQLEKLEKFIKKRRKIAKAYNEAFVDLPIEMPIETAGSRSAYHLYIIKTKDVVERRALYDFCLDKAIRLNVHYYPIHLQPYYRNQGFKVGDFPVSEEVYGRIISLPMYAGLSGQDQSRVIDVIQEFYR